MGDGEAQTAPGDVPVINDPAAYSKTDGASTDCKKSAGRKSAPGSKWPRRVDQDACKQGDVKSNGKDNNNNNDNSEKITDGDADRSDNHLVSDNLSCGASSSRPLAGSQASTVSTASSRASFGSRKDAARNKSVAASARRASTRQCQGSSSAERLAENEQPAESEHPAGANIGAGSVCRPPSGAARTPAEILDPTRELSDSDERAASNQAELDSRRAAGPTTTTTTNLIRRDDSWQSLVSLTRVGRAPTAMQGKWSGLLVARKQCPTLSLPALSLGDIYVRSVIQSIASQQQQRQTDI